MKKCPSCGESLQNTDFYLRYAKCKKCLKLHRKQRVVVPDGYVRCCTCEKIDIDTKENFPQNRTRKSTRCNDCSKEYKNRYGEEKKAGLHPPKKPKPERLKCIDCKNEFQFTEKFFHRNINATYGLLKRCHNCQHAFAESRGYKQDPEKYKQGKINAIEFRTTVYGRSKMIAGLENRRARKHKFLVEEVTAQDIEDMLWFQEACCFYCFKLILKNYNLDHIEPVSNGGKHERGNCVLSCGYCNRAKGAKSYQDWLVYLEKFILKHKNS